MLSAGPPPELMSPERIRSRSSSRSGVRAPSVPPRTRSQQVASAQVSTSISRRQKSMSPSAPTGVAFNYSRFLVRDSPTPPPLPPTPTRWLNASTDL
ncbi:hypothetical protein KEM52_000173, partial [Ascosphaera acerosa]